MTRLHVHLNVTDIAAATRFYSKLLGAEPTLTRDDYARWVMEEPALNLAVSARGHDEGVSHLGLQATADGELDTLYGRVAELGGASLDEGETQCCYARSTKQWVTDPTGTAWEIFETHGDADTFGHDPDPVALEKPAAPCC